jgi:hypothetical protein
VHNQATWYRDNAGSRKSPGRGKNDDLRQTVTQVLVVF